MNGEAVDVYKRQAPEDAEALVSPSAEGEPGKLIVLQEPVKNLYLVASSVMDMFAQLDSMDAISMCGLKEEDWYIPAAKQAMKDGTLLYAGTVSYTHLMVQKNHTRMLEQFACLKKIYPNSHLLLAGEGELQAAMEEKAKRLGIYDSVSFLGVQKDTSIWYLSLIHISC